MKEVRVTARTASRPEGAGTRGILYVHSAPSALCPHIEWAVGGVLGLAVNLDWTPQPAQSGTYRAELSWTGTAGSAAEIASALRGWSHLRFEITEEPTSSSEGVRYSYTPELGVFHAVTGLHGDIMIPEDRLKAAVVKSALGTPPSRSRSTSCSASSGTTSSRPSGTPARALRCGGCTRLSDRRGERSERLEGSRERVESRRFC
jgi:hypothetical protein